MFKKLIMIMFLSAIPFLKGMEDTPPAQSLLELSSRTHHPSSNNSYTLKSLSELCLQSASKNFEKTLAAPIESLPEKILEDMQEITPLRNISNILLAHKRVLKQQHLEFKEQVKKVSWSNDFTYLAAILHSCVGYWNKNSNTYTYIPSTYPSDLINWKADESALALTKEKSCGVNIWNVISQQYTQTIPTNTLVSCLAWNPTNTNLLAIAQEDKTILIYDHEKNSTFTLLTLKSPIESICWNAQGTVLFVAVSPLGDSPRIYSIDILERSIIDGLKIALPGKIATMSYDGKKNILAFNAGGVIGYIDQKRLIKSSEKIVAPLISLDFKKNLMVSTRDIVFITDPSNRTFATFYDGRNILDCKVKKNGTVIIEMPDKEEPKKITLTYINTQSIFPSPINLADIRCLNLIYQGHRAGQLYDVADPLLKNLTPELKMHLLKYKFLSDKSDTFFTKVRKLLAPFIG